MVVAEDVEVEVMLKSWSRRSRGGRCNGSADGVGGSGKA